MRTLVFLLCTCCLHLHAGAQAGLPNGLLKPVTMTAYSKSFQDAFPALENSAALAGIPFFSIGIFSERKFSMQELSSYILALNLPTYSGNFGLRAGYSGFSLHNQSFASLAYGRRLGPKIDVGAAFNYTNIRFAGYGAAGAVTVDAALLVHPSEKVHVGMQVQNPTRARLGRNKQDTLPILITLGGGYEVSEQVLLTAMVDKAENKPANLWVGLFYQVAKNAEARMGLSSATSELYFGAGYHLGQWRLGALAALHPRLGFTPALTLQTATR